MRILHVVGARPNFMKVAPVMRALATRGIRQTLVHTGQHYDSNMSSVFFDQLGMPEPELNLEVGSGSHAVQTAQIMVQMEKVLMQRHPDWVLVYGDVNSTLATALVCAKTNLAVAHIEAGLRSGDRTMPEEINRLLTDQVADLLFTPSIDGNRNLAFEGVDSSKVHLVGNVMIDTLVRLLPKSIEYFDRDCIARWKDRRYILVTLHRPSNVDAPEILERIVRVLSELSAGVEVIFPVHPRTKRNLARFSKTGIPQHLNLIEPLGYLEFLALQSRAVLVITDSGGIQEETTFLGVPCLTVRENTERPITATVGTNTLVGHDMNRLRDEARKILEGHAKKGTIPPLWDGNASERIADIMVAAT